MPIYEYRCPNGHTFELFQKMSEAPPEACPTCATGPVEKVLFPVAVHFKGSGFYATDYGRGSRKGQGKDGDAGAGEKAERPTEKAASDSKPAPASE
ncbi:MAG: zinc ribbon domain-containing protein [Thermoleophilia bacterium]|nr:zinc ribbon domain-containing protein [Thermoleophilia bacterium]